jgi:putative DNA primase/helicase
MKPIDEVVRKAAREATTGRVIELDQARAQRASVNELDFTQDALALEMGERWRDCARYVAAWGRWLFRDERGVWQNDETLEHMTRARAFLRERADQLGPKDDGLAKRLRQADTVAKVVGLARSNEAQAATVNQWDADPWSLGTPEGAVDLRTGELREMRPEDYITKTTAVAPAPAGTPCPLWDTFLRRITGRDDELRLYLQRFFGYTLTGTIREHAFVFAHGGGANGKSVTVNKLSGILGDYSIAVPTEMLMVSHNERHPEELSRLRGVRHAVGNETEEGTRWAEAKIKRLTGGDPIPARYMRQNTFEFAPAFKLVIVGNHRPSLRGIDEAMRRRLHLVPFTVTIPENERDPGLPERLRAEWPAILRWAIDGCLAWQCEGLNPPAAVRSATADYLDAEDALTLWIEESAELDPNAWEASGVLFSSWKRWAERAGEFVGPQKRFAGALEERGFVPKRHTGGIRGFRGIRLNPTDERPEWAA